MISSALRNGLLLSTGLVLLAACEGGGEAVSPGQTGPVTIGGPTDPGTPGTPDPQGKNLVGADGCGDLDEATVTVGDVPITACALPTGTLLTDTRLDASNAYLIQGAVFVGENAIATPDARRATLTIPAGTVLFGRQGTDVLIVSPGSRIEANGTSTNPVVLTSAQDLADGADGASALQAASDATTAAGDTQGQWGGLVVNGLAPVNNCIDAEASGGEEGCTLSGEGGSGLYGGDRPGDDSGTLRYVRVQYAGAVFSGDDELNGIAFQGVGSGTEVDFIQVHNNSDDGVEFFGGTVDADHIVITNAGDDSVDWTSGWTGSIQYGLIVQEEGNNRAIEADGFEDNFAATPFSNPSLANLTILADGGANGSEDEAIVLRRNTDARIYNSVVAGPESSDAASVGVEFDGGAGVTNTPTFLGTLITAFDTFVLDGEGDLFSDENGNQTSGGNTLNGVFLGDGEDDLDAVEIDDDDPNGDDLDDTDYVGAFDEDVDSLDESWAAGWTLQGSLPGATAAGCPEGTTQSTAAVPTGYDEAFVCELPDRVTSDLRLTNGNLYAITGTTFVGLDAGGDAAAPATGSISATLTIDPGVTLYGQAGTDVLIVTRGSQLVANGTRTAPIVLTSRQGVESRMRAQGQWGGLVINGRAGVNNCIDATAEGGDAGCELNGEGGSGLYGGNDDDDDSGSLTFVRVQNAGAVFSGNDELNGIAFQGVGRGTEVSNVQVDSNSDDGVEFFGGTVNARNLLITNAGDDSIDWTSGWRGKVQYALVVQQGGNNRGIEADGFEDDFQATPFSNPTLANLTIIADGDAGGSEDEAIVLRRGTGAGIYNSLIVGPEPTEASSLGVEVDNGSTFTGQPVPTFFSTVIVDVDTGTDIEASAADAAAVFASGDGNSVEENGSVDLVTVPGSTTAVAIEDADLGVQTTEVDEDGDDGFFEDTDYVGALEDGDDDRFSGWVLLGSF